MCCLEMKSQNGFVYSSLLWPCVVITCLRADNGQDLTLFHLHSVEKLGDGSVLEQREACC